MQLIAAKGQNIAYFQASIVQEKTTASPKILTHVIWSFASWTGAIVYSKRLVVIIEQKICASTTGTSSENFAFGRRATVRK